MRKRDANAPDVLQVCIKGLDNLCVLGTRR
jgi:hypothetical protein